MKSRSKTYKLIYLFYIILIIVSIIYLIYLLKLKFDARQESNILNTIKIEEYNDFVENAKEISLYDTNITPKFNDSLITLITCSYHIEDGRFVVIGRKK